MAICHTVDETAETRVAMSLRAKLHAPPHTVGWYIELFHILARTSIETMNLVDINIFLPRKELGKQKENKR